MLIRISLVLNRVLCALVVFYQRGVSPFIAPRCRFRPNCSEYALRALQQHGVYRGVLLTIWRIIRCNPWCKSGYDPVPDRISRVSK